VATRRWIEYVDQLKDDATLDIDHLEEEVTDAVADHNATNRAAEKRLFQSRVIRARGRIAQAKKHRAEARKTLLLDED
jgi:hypothetical protein